MIIYIHSFGSSGQSGKAIQFREFFKSIDEPFIAPSLSYVPELGMSTLEELIVSYAEVTLIGSSLGGYYAFYLAEKYGLKAVLINPAVPSIKSLEYAQSQKGYACNYYDDSYFKWDDRHIEMLEKYEVDVKRGKYLLLLQKDDELLDYKDALDKLPKAEILLEEGGKHTFEKVSRHFEWIRSFLLS
jgi:predicted esterase YcpF (UPF0227 family)